MGGLFGRGGGGGRTPAEGGFSDSSDQGNHSAGAAAARVNSSTGRPAPPTIERVGDDELVIREEPDLPRNVDGFKEAADALVIKEVEETPQRGRGR